MAVVKGKKGTKGQQQIYQENKDGLRFYLLMCIASHVAYAVVQLFVFPGGYTTFNIVMEVASFALQFLSYVFMRMIARPTFTNGQLMDGGIDLAMENGMGEHSKDIIIWTTVTQLASVLHRYLWFLLLLIPLRLVWGVWSSFLSPWFFGGSGRGTTAEAGDEAQRKAEKKQRKAERPKYVVRS